MKTYGVVLAAGLSSRMGQFKPLMPLGEMTVLETCLTNMLQGGVEKIILVVGFKEEIIKHYFADSKLAPHLIYVTNEDYQSTDMLFSIKLALEKLPECDNFFLAPGDMPMIAPQTFLELKSNWQKETDTILCPWIDERKRHPLLIAYEFADVIKKYPGADGLRGLLRAVPDSIRLLSIIDRGCLVDLDTIADYQRLQEG